MDARGAILSAPAKFWAVYDSAARLNGATFASLVEAEKHAEIVARQSSPGQRFYVMEAVAVCERPIMPLRWEGIHHPAA